MSDFISLLVDSRENQLIYNGVMPSNVRQLDIPWILERIRNESCRVKRHQFISNYHLFKWYIREEFNMYILFRGHSYTFDSSNTPQCCLELFLDPNEMMAECVSIRRFDEDTNTAVITLTRHHQGGYVSPTRFLRKSDLPTFKQIYEDHRHARWTQYIT